MPCLGATCSSSAFAEVFTTDSTQLLRGRQVLLSSYYVLSNASHPLPSQKLCGGYIGSTTFPIHFSKRSCSTFTITQTSQQLAVSI